MGETLTLEPKKIAYRHGAYAENPLRRKHRGEHPCLMQTVANAKQAQLAKRILFTVIGPQRNTRNDDSHDLLPPLDLKARIPRRHA